MTTSAKPTRTRKPAEPVPGYTTASEQLKQRRDEFDEALDRIAPKTTTKTDPTAPKGRASTRTGGRGTAKTDMAPAVATPTGNACRCGCGGQTGGTYRQGHDARHVSQLLAAVTAGNLTYLDAVRELPSPNLQAKLQRAHDRAQVKAQASQERQAKKAATDTQKEN